MLRLGNTPLFAVALWLAGPGIQAAPRIHFGEDQLKVSPNEPFDVQIFIDADDRTDGDDLLANGLFGFGIQIDFDETKVRAEDASPANVPNELDFFGFTQGAFQQVDLQRIGVKANVDQNRSPAVPYRGNLLATLSLVNLAAATETYDLGISLFRTLGEAEQIVLDGSGNLLDDDLVFSSMMIQVEQAIGIEGDYDGDGELTTGDIEVICSQFDQDNPDPRMDINGDTVVDFQDLRIWVEEISNTYIGDANLDGEFGTGDFVQVFIVGEYEDGISNNSTWAEGDWNCDGEFDTRDFVDAFQSDGFERGPRNPVTRHVPEPTCSFWFASAITFLLLRNRPKKIARSVRQETTK